LCTPPRLKAPEGNFLVALNMLEGRPAVSHISRKTSEMWGTRPSVRG
jgi:hypothetical protein